MAVASKFPAALATDADLYVAKDGARSALSAAVSSTSATSLSVTDSSKFDIYEPVTVESEVMVVTAIPDGATLTVSRGAFGTVAATHPSGVNVSGYIYAAMHNQTAAEVKAIEALLGASGSGVFQPNEALLFSSDNVYDIGATASGRPKNVYVAGSVTLGSVSTYFKWQGKSQIGSNSDGRINLLDSGGAGFQFLNLGGQNASYPMLKRNGAGIDFKVGDDSAWATIATGNLTSGNLTVNGTATTTGSVGIGTATPKMALDTGLALAPIKVGVYSGTSGDAYGIGLAGGMLTFGAGIDPASGTPQMVLKSAGLVGIGTTAPVYTLHVLGPASNYAAMFDSTANPLIGVRDTSAPATACMGVASGAGGWISGSIAKDALFFSSAGGLCLGTGGATRVYVNSGGSVGVGTVNPAGVLHVHTGTDQNILVRGPVGLSAGASLFSANDGNNALKPMEIAGSPIYLSGSAVGIGATSPSTAVHLYGAGQAAISPTYPGGSHGATLLLQDTGTGANNGGLILFGFNMGAFSGIKGFAQDGSSNTAGGIAFLTRRASTDAALTMAMAINWQGLVGIGTNGPVGQLCLAAPPAGSATKTWGGFNDQFVFDCYSNSSDSSNRYFDIVAAGAPNGAAGAAVIRFLSSPFTASAAPSLRMTISPLGSGRVGIGASVSQPVYQLHLDSDSAAKPASTTWTVSSDGRLKRNIRDCEDDSLAMVNGLRFIRAEYNGLAGLPEGLPILGLLAEEVKDIMPEMVGSTRRKLRPGDKEETEVLDLQYHYMIVHMARSIQQLTARLARLERSN